MGRMPMLTTKGMCEQRTPKSGFSQRPPSIRCEPIRFILFILVKIYAVGAGGGVFFSRWGVRSTWLAVRQAASLAVSRVYLFLMRASSS